MMKVPRPPPKKQGIRTLRSSIFLCGVVLLYLTPQMLLALNAASLDHNCSRDGAGQQKDEWGLF
jgi:hypothetical protein